MKDAPKQTAKVCNYSATETSQGRWQDQRAQVAHNSKQAVAQRKLMASFNNSPHIQEQKALLDSYHNSPRPVARHRQIESYMGARQQAPN